MINYSIPELGKIQRQLVSCQDVWAFQKISNFPMVDLRDVFASSDLLHLISISKVLFIKILIWLTHHKIMA